MNFQEKENFLLNHKNLSNLLLLDPRRPELKKINFKFSDLRNGHIHVQEIQNQFACELVLSNNESGKSFRSMLQQTDLIMIHKMIDYSLPYIMGWNIL